MNIDHTNTCNAPDNNYFVGNRDQQLIYILSLLENVQKDVKQAKQTEASDSEME